MFAVIYLNNAILFQNKGLGFRVGTLKLQREIKLVDAR